MTSTIKDAPASPAGVFTFAGLASAVYTALGTVRDPELDEPITTLGFVASCTVSEEGQAQIRLRLPTYFCAPNFAFLMVADAYDAVTAVPGVAGAEVILDDHFASDAINAGVAARAGFAASFDGEATDELDELRATFLRKAVLAGTDLPQSPKFKGAFVARYSFEDVHEWSPYAQYSITYQTQVAPNLKGNEQAVIGFQPAYALMDFSGGVIHNNTNIDLYISNLADKRAQLTRFTSISPNNDNQVYVVPAQPRTIGIRVSQNF